MDRVFLFDLDDTLIKNHHYYSLAQLDFVRWVIDRTGPRGPDAHYILNTQVNMDVRDAKKNGFGMERFPTSLVNAFLKICAELKKRGIDVSPTEEDVQTAYAIGMRAFDENEYKKNGLFPGARETLDYLTQQKDALILVTKGDPDVQWPKIKATGLEQWFGDRIHIVDQKDPPTLKTIVNGFDYLNTWKVGNSVPSDIEPALEIGLGAVYVPCETWKLEREHHGPPKHPRLLTVKNIDEIIPLYGSLP